MTPDLMAPMSPGLMAPMTPGLLVAFLQLLDCWMVVSMTPTFQ